MKAETFIEQYGLRPYRRVRVEDDGQQPRLRVWWAKNGETAYYAVESVEEAKTVITKLTQTDLTNPYVDWNTCGLEELEDGGQYHEWYDYNRAGASITDIMDNKSE